MSTSERPEWMDNGDCRWEDPELFFAPDRGERQPEREIRERKAKQVCGSCLVRTECFHWAINTRQSDGVWGGTTPLERVAILRRRRRAVLKQVNA